MIQTNFVIIVMLVTKAKLQSIFHTMNDCYVMYSVKMQSVKHKLGQNHS